MYPRAQNINGSVHGVNDSCRSIPIQIMNNGKEERYRTSEVNCSASNLESRKVESAASTSSVSNMKKLFSTSSSSNMKSEEKRKAAESGYAYYYDNEHFGGY